MHKFDIGYRNLEIPDSILVRCGNVSSGKRRLFAVEYYLHLWDRTVKEWWIFFTNICKPCLLYLSNRNYLLPHPITIFPILHFIMNIGKFICCNTPHFLIFVTTALWVVLILISTFYIFRGVVSYTGLEKKSCLGSFSRTFL